MDESVPGDYTIDFRGAVAYDNALDPLAVEIHDGLVTRENDFTEINAWMLYGCIEK